MNVVETTYEPKNSTEVPHLLHNDAKYVIAPLVVIVIIVLLSILVYFMLKMKRIKQIKLNVLSLYEFDSNEQEWESLTNSFDLYPSYQSNNVTISTTV